MKWTKLTAWLALCLIPLVARAQATVRVEPFSIPTYVLGAEDPNPPLWNTRVYPYPMQTDVTRTKRDSAYKAVILENEYVKVIVLPELGGRLYGAFDKTNENFDFIYRNDVIKPGLVGLRGAWLSGGIEWNFPTLGHTVTTVSPVHSKISHNSDGSVSVIVGDTEWVSHMRWTVELTLYPHRSYLKVVTTLFNRTLTHNNGYYWANAAVHATDDAQVVFSPTNYVVGHGGHQVFPWPIHNGVDISWYRNIPNAGSFFCGIPGDFNGVYYHQSDRGTVHVGNRHECPGRKFWTWGTARSGAIWEDILTDHSGQYIEIQSGRLPNQSDTWVFEPHTVEQWVEYWYPVKGMGGFVAAAPEGALNLKVHGKQVFVAANVTEPHRDLTMLLLDGTEELARISIPELTPGQAFARTISLPVEPKQPVLILSTKEDRELVRHRPRLATSSIPKPAQATKPLAEMTAAELALRGYELEKAWNPEGAASFYRKALKLDPGLSAALVRLGIYLFKNGEPDKALDCFDKAVTRNQDNLDARYYRALISMERGDLEGAEDDLWLIGRRRRYSHVAPYLLALCEARRGRWQESKTHLLRAIRYNPDDFQARGLLAAVLRRGGKLDSAQSIINALLKDDPLNAFAHSERYFLLNDEKCKQDLCDLLYVPERIYYRGAEDFLELAQDYAQPGFLEEAIQILHLYLALETQKPPYAMVPYYLAYYSDLGGDSAKARNYYAQAAELPPDYVFPHRRQSFQVLRAAIHNNPNDWKAHYYLGNLLCSKHRWQEGYREFLFAARIDSSYSVLNRNLGQIAWRKQHDYPAATRWYQHALACSPTDYRLYVDLDRLYSILDLHQKRENMFATAPSSVHNNFNVKLREAILYVDTGRYDRALEILNKYTFHPWEGWTGAREVYLLAHFRRGLARLEAGNADDAINDFRATTLYPEDLGTGRPYNPRFTRSYYLLARAFQALGRIDSAKYYFEKAAAGQTSPLSDLAVYRALATRELGRPSEADSALHAIVRRASNQWHIPERRNSYNRYVLGLAQQALGDYEKANPAFEESLKLNPEFRWAKWRL